MIEKADLTGAVLAGGQARRMQSIDLAQQEGADRLGTVPIDKGLLLLHGRPLVAWQQALLRPWVEDIMINANRHQTIYAQYGRVVADDADLPAQQGPLIGLLTILRHSVTPWVVVVPVDSPFLPEDFVPRLLQAQAHEPGRLAYYCRAQRDYPLCLLIHREAAVSLAADIHRGQRRVIPWLTQQSAGVVDFGGHAEGYFANLNTPADFKAAQMQLINKSKA